MSHGEIETEGNWEGSRWCEECQAHHGPLYPCEHYSPSVLEEIALADAKWRETLADDSVPMDPLARSIFKMFAGMD